MQITLSGYVDIPDIDKWLAAVRKEMRRVFMIAGQKFLLAAVPRVPIWTGMARGAFRNLEDLVGKVTNDASAPSGVRIRTTQGRGGAGRGGGEKITQKYRKGYFYYPPGGGKVARTPQSGRAFATPTDQIIDVSGASLASGRTSFYFRFKIDLTYFDMFDGKKWGSFKAGGAALEQFVKDNINLPDPLKYTSRKVIS